MENITMKFSLTEKKVLSFAEEKHQGMVRKGGEEYITHPIAVATYLYERGYRGKYIFTALCHDLLEDTDVTEQELETLCGQMTRKAVKILTKVKGTDTETYLTNIKENELAYHVKIADRIHNLQSAHDADMEFQKKYLDETKKYYLSFAESSPFYKDLEKAYKTLVECYQIAKKSKIVDSTDYDELDIIPVSKERQNWQKGESCVLYDHTDQNIKIYVEAQVVNGKLSISGQDLGSRVENLMGGVCQERCRISLKTSSLLTGFNATYSI